MDEKALIDEVMNIIKYNLISLQKMIIEAKNLELRQTMQSIRDNYESFQYELYKISKSEK